MAPDGCEHTWQDRDNPFDRCTYCGEWLGIVLSVKRSAQIHMREWSFSPPYQSKHAPCEVHASRVTASDPSRWVSVWGRGDSPIEAGLRAIELAERWDQEHRPPVPMPAFDGDSGSAEYAQEVTVC